MTSVDHNVHQALLLNVDIPGYCTAIPLAQAGATWPTSISYSIGGKISANCNNGYSQSTSGLPSATCSAGGLIADSGSWSYYQGSCIGKLFPSNLVGSKKSGKMRMIYSLK